MIDPIDAGSRILSLAAERNVVGDNISHCLLLGKHTGKYYPLTSQGIGAADQISADIDTQID